MEDIETMRLIMYGREEERGFVVFGISKAVSVPLSLGRRINRF